jgi:hypothetical protein
MTCFSFRKSLVPKSVLSLTQMWPLVVVVSYICNIHRFSEICTSFRNTFIWYLTTMYVYCVYPATSKSPRQLTICLKITERSVVLIACNDVVCDVSAYSVIVSFCRSTWIGYQKCIITKYHWCLLDPPLLVLHNAQMQITMFMRFYTIEFHKRNFVKNLVFIIGRRLACWTFFHYSW